MATKKSTKKTASKKAVKKPTTKKVTKKRSYNRKPKSVEAEAINTGADQAPQLDKAQAGDDQMDSIGSFGEFLSQVLGIEDGAGRPEPGNESPVELLRRIDVIDLRGVSVKDRFHTLLLLDSLGYITTSVESMIDDLDNLRTALSTDALQLFHDNKLVRPMPWVEVEACDCQYISKPNVNHSKINLGFSIPEPVYPDETSIGNARYVRVG